MKKIMTLLCIVTINAYAGFNGYTNHSRANCTNNESISWDWTHDWWLITKSDHLINGTIKHSITQFATWTWRSAAVHWGEGQGGWTVHGIHWRHYTDNTFHTEQEEWVTDCSIYDGWWDRNK